MPRSMAGLLAAVGTTVSVLAALVHGDLFLVAAATAGLAMGLSEYLPLPSKKTQAFLLGKASQVVGLIRYSARCCTAISSDGFCQGWAQPIAQRRRRRS
jgi:hypothetical protein